jgi:hypothetical protein
MPGKIDAYVDCGMGALSSTPGVVEFAFTDCRFDSIAILILCDALSTKESQGSRVTWG